MAESHSIAEHDDVQMHSTPAASAMGDRLRSGVAAGAAFGDVDIDDEDNELLFVEDADGNLVTLDDASGNFNESHQGPEDDAEFRVQLHSSSRDPVKNGNAAPGTVVVNVLQHPSSATLASSFHQRFGSSADAPSANANANFAAERFMSGRCLHWLTVVSFLTLSIAVIVLEATDIGTRCVFLAPHNVDDREQHMSPALIP